MFQGSMVAIVTPMFTDGTIDKKSLCDLIEWHIASKTDAIVVAGTTGESATLTSAEQLDIIHTAIIQAKKRIPIIAGTGSNSTQHTLNLTLAAKKAGADACLIVTPYYNKPTQNGLYEHYKFIAEKSAWPIILYNVPTRTSCDLLPETVLRLSKIAHIIGIKEATGKIERANDILTHCKNDFAVFSGDDASAFELIQKGAAGVISVTANIAPEQMHHLCYAIKTGDMPLAKQINTALMPLHHDLFVESNPIPIKWALNKIGLIPAGIRLPLLPLNKMFHDKIQAAMHHAGIANI